MTDSNKKLTQFILKFRKNEENEIFEWFEKQSTPSDSLRYLIQKEIASKGIRDLQEFIPAKRDIYSLRKQLSINTVNVIADRRIDEPVQTVLSESIAPDAATEKSATPAAPTSMINQTHHKEVNEQMKQDIQIQQNSNEIDLKDSHETQEQTQGQVPPPSNGSSGKGQSSKRPAQKRYDTDTLNSYR